MAEAHTHSLALSPGLTWLDPGIGERVGPRAASLAGRPGGRGPFATAQRPRGGGLPLTRSRFASPISPFPGLTRGSRGEVLGCVLPRIIYAGFRNQVIVSLSHAVVLDVAPDRHESDGDHNCEAVVNEAFKVKSARLRVVFASLSPAELTRVAALLHRVRDGFAAPG
jgi:hypothetical protein